MNIKEALAIAEEFFEEESEPESCEPFMIGPRTFQAFQHITEFARRCKARGDFLARKTNKK
jgi:hypothetical protein